MRLLIDIGHPAHVHLFKNIIFNFTKNGHEIQVTARDKEVTLSLLDAYGINYRFLGKNQKKILFKAMYMLINDLKLLKIAREFKPDVLISTGSPYAAHVSALIGKPHIVFTDTEHANLIFKLTLPFTDVICTPSCFKKNLGSKQIRYNGYHELAYLHPKYFTPNLMVLDEIGLKQDERFIILRFVAWNASHDVGQKGISMEMRRRFVNELNKYGRVLITSESELSDEFEPYRIKVAPEKMHDLLYYATLYVGEGGTMASEAAVLGTKSIHISTTGKYCGIFDDLHKYGLLDVIENEVEALEKAMYYLEMDDYATCDKLIGDKTDVTKFMIEIISQLGVNNG